MIIEKGNFFYCDCGFSFERGRSGTHDCGTGLRNKLAESQREFRAADATIENLQMQVEKLAEVNELFLRAKALMHQSGGTPIENSLNPIDAWLYDAERAAGKGD